MIEARYIVEFACLFVAGLVVTVHLVQRRLFLERVSILGQQMRMIDRLKGALSSATQTLDAVFWHAPTPMAKVAEDGTMLSCNPSLCKALGYAIGELDGKSFEHITAEGLAGDLADYKRLIDGQIDHYRRDKAYRHQDGSLVPAHLSVVAQRHPETRDFQLAIGMFNFREK